MSNELEGTIVGYDPMDQLGTIELINGSKVRFGLTACLESFRPEPGARVVVSEIVEGFRGALKARVVRSPGHRSGPPLVPVLERLDEEAIAAAYPEEPKLSAPQVWAGLAEWLASNAPALSGGFADGATLEQLGALSTALDKPLPQELEAAWRVHNGAVRSQHPAGPGAYTLIQVFRNLDLLDCDSMLGERSHGALMSRDVEPDDSQDCGPVRPLSWSESWLPFAQLYGSTHYLCVDLDPPSGGSYGQVIEVVPKSGERRLVCPSVLCFLEGTLTSLRNGEYRIVNVPNF